MFYGICPNCCEEFTKPKTHDLCDECLNIPELTRLRIETTKQVPMKILKPAKSAGMELILDGLFLHIKGEGYMRSTYLWTSPFLENGCSITQLQDEIQACLDTGMSCIHAGVVLKSRYTPKLKKNYASLLIKTETGRNRSDVKIRLMRNGRSLAIFGMNAAFSHNFQEMAKFCLNLNKQIDNGTSYEDILKKIRKRCTLQKGAKAYISKKAKPKTKKPKTKKPTKRLTQKQKDIQKAKRSGKVTYTWNRLRVQIHHPNWGTVSCYKPVGLCDKLLQNSLDEVTKAHPLAFPKWIWKECVEVAKGKISTKVSVKTLMGKPDSLVFKQQGKSYFKKITKVCQTREDAHRLKEICEEVVKTTNNIDNAFVVACYLYHKGSEE